MAISVKVRSWATQFGKAFVTCQECGHKVRFREDICEQCGKRDPVKVPLSALMILVGFCILCLTIVNLLSAM